MNPRINKINNEIDKIQARLVKDKGRLQELKEQKQKLEDGEILATVRSLDVTPDELAGFLQKMKEEQQVLSEESRELENKDEEIMNS